MEQETKPESERHAFQTEIKQLLDLMVHALYSNKDIFLRELISNSSDALDKLRFEQVQNPGLRNDRALSIQITPNREERTLTISDNGIGMSRQEVVANLGTIAKSGTKEFLKAAKASGGAADRPELIGQFGVGFYSSFMVADKVAVTTRRAGEDTATRWTSTGDDFDISDATREEPGTTVVLHLKTIDEENHLRDYTSESVLEEIVRHYSDFVAYPVQLVTWKSEEGSGAKTREEKQLNSQKAIWTRPKEEVTEEEYREFYKHIAHDWNEPLDRIVVKIEGTFEAQALLFIPSQAPFDLYHPEMKRGIQLYVKRVFIMDECKDLLPPYLRFVKGVVDAQDLSLNVSREILQQDRQIRVIRKQLVKRVFGALETMLQEHRPKYGTFYETFGAVLKEGLTSMDPADQKAILPLVLTESTAEAAGPTTLDEYIERMKPDQDAIYYLTGPSRQAALHSPHLEAFKAKGYEVLVFTDPVDEIWVDRVPNYREKPLRSVGRGEIELGSESEQKDAQEKRAGQEETYKGLLGALRSALQDDIKEVRLSSRLTESPACLVGDKGDLSPQMERIMKQLGQDAPKVKRILEVNADHPVLQKLKMLYDADAKSGLLGEYAELLYGQSLLAEGSSLPDPAKFSHRVAELMVRAVPETAKSA
jgi:molecular chaperone HtpG